MAQSDVREVDRRTGEVKKQRRFDERDFKWLAEFVVAEYERRKRHREDRERHWKEIDRQIAMEPSTLYKMLPDGSIDQAKKWMAETELPLQAQALEVLTADARKLMFPPGDPWFRAHTKVTDDWLQKVEGPDGVRVLGDKNYIPSKINQDNADKIVEGFLINAFRKYDHHARFDVINAESFKYGVGVGRGRLERSNIWITEARGIRSEKQRVPVIVPCSIKNIYLEETKPSLHSATVLGPAHIAVDYLKYESIAIAANKGETDPDNEDGGWMPRQLSKVIPDKRGYVLVLEMEGDIVVPRKTVKSVTIPGAIITVAIGGKEGDQTTKALIRLRFRKYPFGSYLLFPYMAEGADDIYCSSPLMKGRTVQQAATDATNKFFDSAALKNSPPIGWDRNDPTLGQMGGPAVYPTALWPTNDPAAIRVFEEVGGDPTAMAQAAFQFVNLYAELTGVLPARIGAQTKSHTTATAKQQEVQRSTTRTVDYVNAIGHGPVTNWLYMAYEMGKKAMSGKLDLYIESYGGWVEIDKGMLPESEFEWFGASGPQDKQQKQQNKLNALMLAAKIDQLRTQMGMPPRLNLDTAIDQILRDGGWDDISNIVNIGGPSAGAAQPSGVPGAGQANPGAAVAALQNLSTAGA